MKRLFHFLGSIYFALALIFFTALMAIIGTILEAGSDSHLFAAQYVYSNPFFSLLLSLYFVNILFSSLRRWPFKKRHIPFLMTHLGLLMILSGCFIKLWYGIQGQLLITEGSANNKITIPHTFALQVARKNGQSNTLPFSLKKPIYKPFPELKLKMISYAPHVKEKLEAFVEENIELSKKLITYNKGFGGYGVEAQIPFASLTEKEKDDQLIQDLNLALNHELVPPLEWFKKACEKGKTDFSTNLVEFLKNSTLHDEIKKNLNPADLPKDHLQGCLAVAFLFERLKGVDDVEAYLKSHHWPFPVENKNIAQQLFSAASQLPPMPLNKDISEILSAYLKAYGVEYKNLMQRDNHTVAREFKIFPKHVVEKPPKKIEERCPGIVLEAQKNKDKQLISLVYSNLKWPVLNGEYLIRFQAQEQEIPYKIRLRKARQINYIDSNQPYSYECDIVVTGKEIDEETSLSMNKVYETEEGYRFYLAGMSKLESGIKRVQLVVNYDPAKYLLTYPGAVLVAFGAILLFWLKR